MSGILDSSRLGSASLGSVRLGGFESPSGGVIVLSFNDSLSFSDAFLLPFIDLVFNDSYTISDSFSNGSSSVNFILNDTFTLAESLLAPILQPAFFFQDAFSILDQSLPNLFFNEIFNDSFSLSDALTLENLFVVNLQFTGDFLNFQDGIFINDASVVPLTINDSFSFSDVLGLHISIPFVFVDNLKNWLDFISIGTTNRAGFELGDFLIFGDSASLLFTRFFSENDSFALSDSITTSVLNTGKSDSIGDSFSINDGLSLLLVAVTSVTLGDSYSLSDDFVVSVPEPLNNYLRRYLNDVVM